MSSAFGCSTCVSKFDNSEEQRNHFQSEWHKYNLRRKVSDLPPVTISVFTAKVASKTDVKSAVPADTAFSCDTCNKEFSSQNSYSNHLQSKKHIELKSKPRVIHPSRASSPSMIDETPMVIDGELTDDKMVEMAQKALLLTFKSTSICIFCSSESKSASENVRHMKQSHGLFIPYESELDEESGIETIVRYLQERVAIYHSCFSCEMSKAPFQSVSAVRKHMLDKGHTSLKFDEDDEQMMDCYNFDKDDVNGDENDDSWTDCDEDLYGEGSALIAEDGSELILANGKVLGHRQFRHIFKQNLIPYDDEEERRRNHQLLLENGTVTEPFPVKTMAHDIARQSLNNRLLTLSAQSVAALDADNIRSRRTNINRIKTQQLNVGIGGNKLMHYYRYQLL